MVHNTLLIPALKAVGYSVLHGLAKEVSREVQPLMDLTLNGCVKPYLLIVTQSWFFWCFLGKQVSHTKAPALIYTSSEGKHHALVTLVHIVFTVPNNPRAPGVPEASVSRVVQRLRSRFRKAAL